jgi:hypothetical protein
MVTFALTLLTGLAFGLGPALAVGVPIHKAHCAMRHAASTESTRSRRMRGLLVAGQIALCVSLLAAAGLLARSLWELTTAPLGFNPNKLLTFTVQLPNANTARPSRMRRFIHSLLNDCGPCPA